MTKVLTFGVFDYFHIGHLNLLRQCREHGDYLIVGVQNGEYVTMEKTEFDVLALGEDHIGGRFDAITEWCRAHGKSVVRLKRTPGISSSDIKGSLKMRRPEETDE